MLGTNTTITRFCSPKPNICFIISGGTDIGDTRSAPANKLSTPCSMPITSGINSYSALNYRPVTADGIPAGPTFKIVIHIKEGSRSSRRIRLCRIAIIHAEGGRGGANLIQFYPYVTVVSIKITITGRFVPGEAVPKDISGGIFEINVREIVIGAALTMEIGIIYVFVKNSQSNLMVVPGPCGMGDCEFLVIASHRLIWQRVLCSNPNPLTITGNYHYRRIL